MNSQLLKYYKNYLDKDKNDKSQYKAKTFLKSNEYITLFLECLLSCNNIEKFNTEIFGNSTETEIFKNMKWDIKSYRFNNSNINSNELPNDYSYLSNFYNDNNNFCFDSNLNLIDKNINEIYPNNYYKITESYKNQDEIKNKIGISRINTKYELMNTKSTYTNISEFSIAPNNIKQNIYESQIILNK
jgi:hypothetical protein